MSDEEEEDIDFSTNLDGFIKINKQGNKTNGHYNRFVKH
jgi:hypothetical protein